MVGIVWFFGKSLIVDASLLSEAERLARIAGVIGEPRKPWAARQDSEPCVGPLAC